MILFRWLSCAIIIVLACILTKPCYGVNQLLPLVLRSTAISSSQPVCKVTRPSSCLDRIKRLWWTHSRPANTFHTSFESRSNSTRQSFLLSWFPFLRSKLPNKKVLILMSDTGGGHRASAEALDQAIQDQFPGRMEVEIMDIWTSHGHWPFNRCVSTYRFLAKHPLLWRGFYAYGAFPLTRKLTEAWSSISSYDSFRKAIRSSSPDLVVSVHPLCQYIPLTIIAELNKEREAQKQSKIPFVTVVTDLADAHTTWFDNRADAYFVPSEAVRQLAIRNGISTEKIILRGLPIRPAFWKELKPKAMMRRSLGLDWDRKTVLLMGGGDGVGGMVAIANEVAGALRAQSFPTQLIVICGHNQRIASTLRGQLSPMQDRLRVAVKGFVQNIDEFMAASDCLITKAGPGTISEAMIRGLPLILSSFLPGQETGNVPYVVDNGFGVYTGNDPIKIAKTITWLFNDERKLEEMSRKAKLLSRPEATISIARDIGETVLSLPISSISPSQ